MAAGGVSRIAIGDRVSIPPGTNAAMYGTAGTVVGRLGMPTGWVCLGVLLDGESDRDDPWLFAEDQLALLDPGAGA